MISSISVEATITARPNPGDNIPDPSRVTFFRDLAERSKRCSNQVNSHITGAPIGLNIRALRGKPDKLNVRFSLPVALSFVGQGLIHGWTECLGSEKKVASHLMRKVLEEQEFKPEEAFICISNAKATSTSLVWHVELNSLASAKAWLERAAYQVKVLRDHNDDDFYGIQDYVLTDTSTEVSLQIMLSSGNGLKLSIQPEHLSKYTDLHVVQDVIVSEILAMTKTKIRIDATIGWQLFGGLEIGSPWDWSGTSLESCVDAIFAQAGFVQKYVPHPEKLSLTGYPKGAQIIHAWYLRDPEFQGLDEEYVANFYDMLLKDGVDLHVRPSEHKFLDGSIGEKLHFSNRWQVPLGMDDLIVSTRTEPGLILALANGLHPPRQEIWTNLTPPFVWERLPSKSDDDWYATES